MNSISTPLQSGMAEACAASPAGLLTPRQLAQRLGVSRRTLSSWTRDKLLPMIKIGGNAGGLGLLGRLAGAQP